MEMESEGGESDALLLHAPTPQKSASPSPPPPLPPLPLPPYSRARVAAIFFFPALGGLLFGYDVRLRLPIPNP